jgi:thiol-disulfide isomerase/thioredoxin
MITLHALTLLAALSAPGQTVLLDFYAPWCGPCQSMEPTLRRLAADGYPVRMVNVDQEPALARQFRVDSVPTYVLVADGREAGRQVGPASYGQLTGMFAAVRPAAPAAPPVQPVAARQPAAEFGPPPAGGTEDARTRAMAATVRLCIEDAGGRSFGTGTIIDVHQGEALVMTCGHLFRESRGQGPMSAEVFPPGASAPVPAQVLALLTYDLDQDVALLAIRPNCPVASVPVAPAGYLPRRGDRVFSIGCDQGAAPSLRESQITALDKYKGPPNIESAGQPIIGRSGGGLFSADGQLIGVCNLADPKDDEGIYAALPLLHGNLDKIGQSRVYQRAAANTALAQAPPQPALPQMPAQMPPSPLGGGSFGPAAGTNTLSGPLVATAAQAAQSSAVADDEMEVLCLVRSKRNPHAPVRTIYLEQPSRMLLDRMANESRPPLAGGPVELQAIRNAAPPPRTDSSNNGPIMRGQPY